MAALLVYGAIAKEETMFILLAIVTLSWVWIGVKTWAFVAKDLTDGPKTRTTVICSFFGGLLWPITYIVLVLLLLSGVTRGRSFKRSVDDLKGYWYESNE
jgi:hypothetical protein